MHRRLRELGGTLLALSIDPPATAADIAKRLELSFPVLSDPELKVIDAYGLRHHDVRMGFDHSLPAMFLVDRGGIIRWKRVAGSLQDRPAPHRILEQIAALPTS